jgi:inner membrane protein
MPMSQQTLAFIAAYAPWLWILLALVLFGIEAIAPGIYALWFAVAALVIGVATVALGLDLPLGTQITAFVGLAVVAVAITKGLDRGVRAAQDGDDLNDRSGQIVGRTVVVDDAITNGRGRVRVGDTTWQATGPDCPVGATVKVIATDGMMLRVEPV